MLAFLLLLIGLGVGTFFATRAFTGGSDQAAAEFPAFDQLDIRAEGPDFSGKTLHWREESRLSSPTSPDPANGKSVTTDVWVQMGSLNSPIAVRSIATLEGGTIYQAQLLLQDQGLLLFGSKVPGSEVPGEASCSVNLTGPASAANMEGIRPFYVDPVKADFVGLRSIATDPMAHPALDQRDLELHPESVLDPSDLESLAVDLPIENATVYVLQEVDNATGLQRAQRVEVRGKDGSVLSEQERSMSAIQVFADGTAPAGIFSEDSLPGVNCQ